MELRNTMLPGSGTYSVVGSKENGIICLVVQIQFLAAAPPPKDFNVKVSLLWTYAVAVTHKTSKLFGLRSLQGFLQTRLLSSHSQKRLRNTHSVSETDGAAHTKEKQCLENE